MKEIKKFQVGSKEFDSKVEAERYLKKLTADETAKRLGMTIEEIQESLEKVAPMNHKVKILLKAYGGWTNWELHQIRAINKEILDYKTKTTKYIMEKRNWGEVVEEELYSVEGDEFEDPELYCADTYKVERVEDGDNNVRKVYYDYKYSWSERVLQSIKKGERLTEGQIARMLDTFPEVYTEEDVDRRWSRTVLTVLDLDGDLYAVEWEEGLTENQENTFMNQPYPVELEKEEVVVTKTKVIRKDK